MQTTSSAKRPAATKRTDQAGLCRAIGLAATALLCVGGTARAAAPVTYLGAAVIPGTGTDQSGLPGTLLEDGASPLNGLNGFGSGIAYTGAGERYGLLADRGPNKFDYAGGKAVDNTTSYPNRYQLFDIGVTPSAASATGYTVSATNVGTTLLRDAAGETFSGLSTAFAANPAVQARRLDPEGIRFAPDGTVYVSDEYGPAIYHFDSAGNELGALDVPANFRIAHPGPTVADEAAANASGRVTNHGLEGLAISPDGGTLVAALQGPLRQDGGDGSVNTRLLVYDLTQPGSAPRQFVYQLDNPHRGISEIVAVNGHSFLVDERDNAAGAAGTKLLYKIDLDQPRAPTDLAATPWGTPPGGTSDTAGLPSGALPDTVVPVAKTEFADIGALLRAAHPFQHGTHGLPDKIEGYAFGPDLPNGDHLMLVTNDNDFVLPGQDGYRPNYIFAFRVAAAALPDFQPEATTAAAAIG